MRKHVAAICLLNVDVPMRDESRKGYLLKDHGLAWDIETRYLPRTNAAPVHLRGDTVKTIRNSSPWETVCSFWRGRQEQPDNVPRTKWYNNYAEARQLMNLFTPKTKERDIRKYGKPHLNFVLSNLNSLSSHFKQYFKNRWTTVQKSFFSVNGFFFQLLPPLPSPWTISLIAFWAPDQVSQGFQHFAINAVCFAF